MIQDYKIIEGWETPDNMADKIKEALKDGWKLHKDLIVTIDHHNYPVFHQVMVKRNLKGIFK